MAFMNEGTLDRVIRIVAGLALVYAAWLTWPVSVLSTTGTISLVFLVVGAIALITGIVGWCPMYTVFNVSTRKRIGA